MHNNMPINPDNDTIAAIATAISLSGNTESCLNLPSEIAAAIATALNLSGKTEESCKASNAAAAIGAALFLHLFKNTTTVPENNHKVQALSFWSQYGRANAQDARQHVFNRSRA